MGVVALIEPLHLVAFLCRIPAQSGKLREFILERAMAEPAAGFVMLHVRPRASPDGGELVQSGSLLR
eukprot:15717889-Heterocapsa_arctica.AAC.1